MVSCFITSHCGEGEGVLFVCTLDVGWKNNVCFTIWLVMRHVKPFFDVGVILFGSFESGAKGAYKLGKVCVSHSHFWSNAKHELHMKAEPLAKEACPPYWRMLVWLSGMWSCVMWQVPPSVDTIFQSTQNHIPEHSNLDSTVRMSNEACLL